MIDTYRGDLRARAWPTKRGIPKSPVTRAQNERFRKILQMVKYLSPREHIEARAATAGTPLYPRDILTMCAYGRAYYIERPDGRIVYTMSQRTDISDSLDILGSDEGHVLVRGADYWEAVPYNPGGGGGASFFRGSFYSSWDDNSGSDSTKGNIIRPFVDCTLWGIEFLADPGINYVYRGAIAEIDPDTLIILTEPIHTEEFTVTATGTRKHRLAFPFYPDLVAGKVYALTVSRINQGGFASPWTGKVSGATYNLNGPIEVDRTSIYRNAEDLEINENMSESSSWEPYQIDPYGVVTGETPS